MKWSVLLLLTLITACASFSEQPVASQHQSPHHNPALVDMHARFR